MGAVVALITLIDNAYTPIAIFNVIYVQYKLDITAWLRFTGLLDLKEDVQLQEGVAFGTLSDGIRVENLSFSYGISSLGSNDPGNVRHSPCSDLRQSDLMVLDHVSLTIRRGEKVAFVGESGSGKSTLAKILTGLLKYETGDIFFDGEPLKEFSLESLYEKVSYLSQDAPVFDGTIRENLVFDREVSDAGIHVSLENTQLLSMLAALDNGVDTRIGERGTCLSGGEKQRLALARLWFDDPEIVVLDEATSALDNVTEGIVMKNVLMRLDHATVIAIVHRLTSISEFDRIYVFRDGKIVGNGTFEELLANNSYFAELYRRCDNDDEKQEMTGQLKTALRG